MSEVLEELIRVLDLEQLGPNKFVGHSPADTRKRVFGGQVAAQALIAAGRTVADGRVHSLHSYFLRPGDIKVPILFEVDRIRDGRSFKTRRVVASQKGQAIFNLSTSFHRDEDGVAHQASMPDVPDPLSLPTFRERMSPWAEKLGDWNMRLRPLEQRYVGAPQFDVRDEPREPRQQVWVRADGELGDDPLLHPAIATYATDMSLLDTVMLPHKLSRLNSNLMLASLDHSVWFHRPFRTDRWFLFDQESPVSYGARALIRGQVFSHDGNLVASVAQEGLIRVAKPS